MLFITCADSRVVPSLITQTKPGDIFVERNPGNIVPVYSRESTGVAASIEYAISVLGVEHLIVCGHSDCGAVKGILHPDKLADVPAVGRWLAFGKPALKRLERIAGSAGEQRRLGLLTGLNVVVQLEHLMTHPSVKRAVRRDAQALRLGVPDRRRRDPAVRPRDLPVPLLAVAPTRRRPAPWRRR